MTPETFKAARLATKLTQIKLAQFAGLSERQIIRYENGASAVPEPMAMIMLGLSTGQWPKVKKPRPDRRRKINGGSG